MSTLRTVTLNASALAVAVAFASAPKVRVRTSQDGTVQLRPTDRVSAVNLPKTEALRDLRAKANSRRFSVTNDALNIGAAFDLVAGKYGWFSLVPTTGATVGARVTER